MRKRKAVKKTALSLVLAGAMLVTGIPSMAVGAEEAKEADGKAVKLSAETMNQNMKLWYETPANVNTGGGSGGDWMQESLPLGNGNLGNLIFGGVEKERIHFNEKTLWTGGPSESRPNYNFGNQNLVNGEQPEGYTAAEIQEYREILDDKSTNVFNDADGYFGNYGYVPIRFKGGDMYKGEYQDFGDIWLDYSAIGVKDSNAKNYRRELDLQTGIATTKFEYKGVTYTREHFVSSPDNVMVTRLTADKKGKLSVGISMELNNGGLSGTPAIDVENNTYTISGKVNDNGLKFRTTMKVIPEGGSIKEGKNGYEVKSADSILIVMAAETDYLNDFPTYRDTDKDLAGTVDGRVEAACASGADAWDKLKSAHLGDHQEMFDRVSMDLGENLSGVPTNELVDNYRDGNYSTYLEALSFQYGRYLSIAGSRGYLPSNLVGLWTVGGSAWTGDYHFNVNVQMNYWPVYVTNLEECGETMVNYMESLREPGRRTAELIHGIEGAEENHIGFTVHTENNPFGMTAPSNAQEYGWNPTGAAWAIQNIWQDYEFTQDAEYLKSTIYPIMKEAALFWDNYLWTSDYQVIEGTGTELDGTPRLVVAPSFSEEQGPTVIGSTYDQSLVWELYKECLAAAEVVGETDTALLTKWKYNMEHLDPININATNGIKEWYEETRVGTESGHNQSYAKAGDLAEIAVPNSGWWIGHPGEHRHSSHLVGLYPGTLINKENEEYISAAIQSLTERGPYSTGWSKANKVNLWARTGEGNEAYKVLNNLIGGNASGLQYNLFDSHGTGGGATMMSGGTPVWQIDGNYGLTAGVAEMLVQSHMGYTEFLPAIPDAWQNGEVNGLKARGDFEIDQTWRNGMAESFTVRYDAESGSKEFTGAYENINLATVTVDGEVVQTTSTEDGKITFTAEAGKNYKIDMMIDTNLAELKAKAMDFLNTLHQDLSVVSDELLEAINSNSSELGMILQKAQLMDGIYREVLGCQDDIYYMTTKNGLSIEEIDTMYNRIRTLKKTLLENTGDIEYYQTERNTLKKNEAIMSGQMENRVISFSMDSGMVSADDTVTLSKHADATDYTIRYTTDGSQPTVDSAEYAAPISMDQEGDVVIRAALFDGDQRVSEIYTRQYMKNGITVNNVALSENAQSDWGSTYAKEKMIDRDSATRWASKGVSGDVEIELGFDSVTEINRIRFDVYVSSNNSIEAFDIQAKQDGAYTTVYSADKLADFDDMVGGIDGSSGGGHAYYLADFNTVNTDSIKVILKGYSKEPSFYEIQPMLLGAVTETPGNAAGLNEMITDANAKLTEVDAVDAPQALKDSFKESIADAAESVNAQASQAELDSREEFLRNRYYRLGFGVTDKSVLESLIAQAEEAAASDYSRDSMYRLGKALDAAKVTSGNEEAKQPEVDRMTAALQTALDELEPVEEQVIAVSGTDMDNQGGWIEAGGFMATNANSGPLSYTFAGNGLSVTTVKASDHGIIKVIITDQDGNIEFEDEIDTFASSRVEGVPMSAELTDMELEQGTYTISFERVGHSTQPNATGQGWVEVKLTITQPFEETVDRSSLESEITLCDALKEADYTTESWAEFQIVLNEAKDIFAKTDLKTCTSEMEDWAEKLAAGRGKLKTDATALAEEIEQAKAIKADGYTAESFANLQAVIADAETFLNGDGGFTPDEVAAKVASLKQAVIDLAVDKASVQEQYNRLNVDNKDDLTKECKEALEILLAKADAFLQDENPTASDAAALLAEMQGFTLEYEGVVDKTEVQNKYDELAGLLDKPNLTEKSREELQELLKDVKDNFLDNKDAKAEDVAKYLKKLNDFKPKYEDVPGVDIDKLEKELKKAEEIKADGYTAESYDALQAAIKTARDMLANGGYTQSQVDAQLTMVQDAVKTLEVDVKSVQDKYNALKDADKSNLTDKCQKSLEKLLEEVEKFLGDMEPKAEKAAELLKKMNEFEFEYKEDKPETGDTEKPGTGDSEKPGTDGTGKPAADNKDAAVKTGDTSPIIPIAAAAIVSMLIIAVMLKRKRR